MTTTTTAALEIQADQAGRRANVLDDATSRLIVANVEGTASSAMLQMAVAYDAAAMTQSRRQSDSHAIIAARCPLVRVDAWPETLLYSRVAGREDVADRTMRIPVYVPSDAGAPVVA